MPIYVKNVARVALGPALRRGALDKEGAEVVGGVVVARYGANPLAAIESVKAKIAEIAPSLPKKTLPDGAGQPSAGDPVLRPLRLDRGDAGYAGARPERGGAGNGDRGAGAGDELCAVPCWFPGCCR